MSSNGDRRREIAYHDLERAEDEQALHGRASERGGQRDQGAAARHGTRERESAHDSDSSRERNAHLTQRERRERWPIG